ncbi:MAG: TonB-dependent receptor [Bryobacteraceae bacterium]
MTAVWLALWLQAAAPQQSPPPQSAASSEKPAENASADSAKRVELNLLGKTDTAAGESRRNENVQFNLVDNNALKELNLRLGTSATLVQEFRPDRNYFGAEFGNAPSALLHLAPAGKAADHGSVFWSHLNSVSSARSFFQVGGVKPAHENEYGFSLSTARLKFGLLQIDGSQQKIRGNVNGNVLVPRLDQRTSLATDPATRALVSRFLNAFPRELPNRTEFAENALNTNAPQIIDGNNAGIRLDTPIREKDRVVWQYQYTSQFVDAFQLVAGQNPDTTTRNQRARVTWNRNWSASTLTDFTAGFERIRSILVPEPNAVGPMVSASGLTTLGPLAAIPINRAQNMFRYGGQLRQNRGQHNWTLGFGLLRRQFNGIETDAHRGVFSFANDFGRTAIDNLRLGTPTQYIISIGEVNRGFRNWDMQYYAGDTWRVRGGLSLSYGLRYQPVTRPYEVYHRNPIAYDCDCNNFAPQFGLAWRPSAALGVVRASYALHYGEIFPVTFTQVRFSPPGSMKIVVTAPNLINPLVSNVQTGQAPKASPNLYLLDPELSTPYSHQYNFAWEPGTPSNWKVQFGYVGSRSHKLLIMWYLNRSHAVAGIPQTTATINQRRPDPDFAEKRLVINGSRGYFDAFRATLIVPRWRGVSIDASYWFSKALDLGSSYTNTAYEADSRLSRSQSEYDQQKDMRGLSSFDQPHAFLVRASYTRWKWSLSSVTLLKSGTPFTVQTGADGPGFGNVDGNGGDRPNLRDLSVLGRTIGNPDTSRALLPRAAFSFFGPLEEFGGNLGKNTFRKGGIYNVNAALSRNWKIANEKTLAFRAESINFLNTPQFAEPGFELSNPNFAAITNTLNDGRTFRVQLRFGW